MLPGFRLELDESFIRGEYCADKNNYAARKVLYNIMCTYIRTDGRDNKNFHSKFFEAAKCRLTQPHAQVNHFTALRAVCQLIVYGAKEA
jgi:hypothetical protein